MMSFLATVTIVAPLIVALLTWLWLLVPSQGVKGPADAVVVFAGGRGERLDKALQTAQSESIPNVVLSVGAKRWPGRAAITNLCDTTINDVHITCMLAPLNMDSTAGEASLFADLAARNQFRRLVVITNHNHLFRASLRLRQCFDGHVDRIGVAGNTGLKSYIHEWGGILHALILDRRCTILS